MPTILTMSMNRERAQLTHSLYSNALRLQNIDSSCYLSVARSIFFFSSLNYILAVCVIAFCYVHGIW